MKELLSIFFFSISVYSLSNYNYAIQNYPLVIVNNFNSQVLFCGYDLILWCNVSLSNKYDVLFQWRHNGQYIQNGSKNTISDYKTNNMVFSELHVSNLSVSNGGNYECLVLDGLMEDGDAAFITVSNTAVIKVLDEGLESDIVNITRSLGQNILLPCNNIAHLGIVKEVIWRKGEQELLYGPSTPFVLKNGSLFIYNFTEEDEGYFQCSSLVLDRLLYSSIYNISLSGDEESVQPIVLTDLANQVVVRGEVTSISCCFFGMESINYFNYQLNWFRRDNFDSVSEVLQVNSSVFCNHLVIPVEFLGPGHYEYGCRAVLNGSMLNSSSILKVVDVPSMLPHIKEELTSPFEYEVSLDCPLSTGSDIKFTWYRNGEDITSSCNHTTGHLRYYTTEEDSTFGIYQCFARNEVGSDSAIVRIVNGGFANPPEDFTCYAQDQSSRIDSPPSAILQWNPPIFFANYLGIYGVKYDTMEHLTPNTSLEINLHFDQSNVVFQVYVQAIDQILRDGAIATCEIQSTLERRTLPSNARGVTVTCPFPGGVSWDNPSIPITLENIDSGIFLELEEYQIYCVCLHEAHAMMYGVSDQFAPFDGIISFTVEEQPVGSFCIVGGRYHFRSRSLFPLFIPPQVCKIPTGSSDLTASLLLDVSYDASIVSISPILNDTAIEVQGNCILDDSTVLSVNFTLPPANSETDVIETFHPILGCSLVASYMDVSTNCVFSESLQYIKDQFMEVRLLQRQDATVCLNAPMDVTEGIDATLSTSSVLMTSDYYVTNVFIRASAVIVLFVSSITLVTLLIILCLKQKHRVKIKNKMWQKAVESVCESGEVKESHEESTSRFCDTQSAVTIFEQLGTKEDSLKTEDHEFSNTQFVGDHGDGSCLNSSNTSGYETESESREYFISRNIV